MSAGREPRLSQSPKRTDFVYDPLNDVVVATPHWRCESLTDIINWRQQYEAFLKPFRRKMDVVVILGDFHLAPRLSPAWGEARARIHREYMRFSVRVHPTEPIRSFIYTSSVRHSLSADQAPTLADAIALIKRLRESAIAESAAKSSRTARQSSRRMRIPKGGGSKDPVER